MFCTKCGSQCADNAAFCTTCGAPMNAAPQQPVYQQPAAPQQPVYQQPAPQPVAQIAPATAHQKKMAVILAILAVFALVVGILHTFCLVDLPMSMDVDVETKSLMGGYDDYDYDDYGMGMSMSSLVPSVEIDGSIGDIYVSPGILSELFDLLDSASGGMVDASFSMGYVGLIVFGVINLLIAVVGILFYLRARSNNGLYDQFFGSFIKAKSPALILGIAGVAACLIQIVCMWFTGFEIEQMGMSLGVSVGVHWITWIALIAYGALTLSQLLAIDKNEA